jgi:DNA-binding response OmpR family regulator
MSEAARILVVDDEEAILDFVNVGLTHEGYQTRTASDGRAALESFRTFGPDLVILDLMLPDRDGIEVCRDLRAASDVLILMLTARGSLVDRVAGLDSGADDYLAKPFRLPELLARVRALLRRVGRGGDSRALTHGDLVLDTASRRVTLGGRPIELTRREFDLLELLATRPGQVYNREQILSRIWGYDFVGETNVVDVHVSAIRGKLGDRRIIRTVRGVGYALEASQNLQESENSRSTEVPS